MSKSILLTGATGFVGKALSKALTARGDTVIPVTREWKLPAEADCVVHLAGENVAQRWGSETKKKIRESRIGGLEKLRAVNTGALTEVDQLHLVIGSNHDVVRLQSRISLNK